MFDVQIKGDEAIIPVEQLLELMNYKLNALKEAKENDSSWNYGIEELEEQITELQFYL